MKYCLSGGASGSDKLFASLSKEFNYTALNYSFKEHKLMSDCGINILLSDKELYSYLYEYKIISNQLGRAVSNKPYIQKLILRDFYQIYGRKNNKTELVIAISEISNNNVDIKGGTGYAVKIAMNNHIPIILIDKKDNYSYKFFDYSLDTWRILKKSDLFKIKSGFTGIGSREINVAKAEVSVKKLLNVIL